MLSPSRREAFLSPSRKRERPSSSRQPRLSDANDVAVGLAARARSSSRTHAPFRRDGAFITALLPARVRPAPARSTIENTNRGCALSTVFNAGKDIEPATSLNGLPCDFAAPRGCGTGIVTGKSSLNDAVVTVNGGGVPIFKDGQVVGGIGVTGVPAAVAETAALVGSVLGLTNDRFGPRRRRDEASERADVDAQSVLDDPPIVLDQQPPIVQLRPRRGLRQRGQ